MSRFSLHVVTDGKRPLDEVVSIVKSFPKNSVDVIHIREKHRTASELFDWSQALTISVREAGSPTSIHVNDRLDSAIAAQVAGAHLAYHSLPIAEAKKLLPKYMRMGISVHTLKEAKKAEKEGADYVFYGHIYASSSKPGLPPRGIGSLQKIVDTVEIPVIAIGGIHEHNLPEVLTTGCSGIALISNIWEADDPGDQVKKLRQILDQTASHPKVLYDSPFGKY
jgi:thiazole tautomerase (transcriptional regulator TenI)